MTQFIVRRQFIALLLPLLLLGLLAACQASAVQMSDAVSESAPAPTPTAESAAAAENSNQSVAIGGNVKTFQLTQTGTEARFYIDEVLMGQDKTVVGVTSRVEGQIIVDPANPSSAQISPIRIDARDLTTDSNQRNGAIRRFVLQSNQDQYQYINFEPTAVTGLPAAVEIGKPFEFMVTGNLTVRTITHEETFQLSVTATSENELVGLGATTIARDKYELTIPSVPSVANVSEEVKLEIEFVATAS